MTTAVICLAADSLCRGSNDVEMNVGYGCTFGPLY